MRKDCTHIPETTFLLIKMEELHFIDYMREREIYIEKLEKWRDRERERELFHLSVVLGFGGLEVYWLILVIGIRGCEISD